MLSLCLSLCLLFMQVTDHYTRDRSTPVFDEEFGGSESLTAATGYQAGDQTTIIKFRRKLTCKCIFLLCTISVNAVFTRKKRLCVT